MYKKDLIELSRWMETLVKNQEFYGALEIELTLGSNLSKYQRSYKTLEEFPINKKQKYFV